MKLEIRHQSVRFKNSGYLAIIQGSFNSDSLIYVLNKITIILR